MDIFRADVAFDEFEKFRNKFGGQIDINEATTRLRLIDSILFEVLLWPKQAVETEKFCKDEGYADYVHYLHERPTLVIEAKKTGTTFAIPQKSFENRPYIFGLLAKESRDAAKALQQAIGYAANLGTRYVAISNGHQWIFTLTFVPDQPIENRLIYIFESLAAISNRFQTFCDCFSMYGLEKNAVSRDLLDSIKQPAPAKLSSKIPGYPQPASRNIFQNELSYILEYVWQVLSQEEGTITFLENCYVEPMSHADIIALVRELLQKRRNEDEILVKYEVLSIGRLPYELAHLPSERPFAILGEIGRGKTSFLKFLKYIAAKELLKSYIQLDLNFNERPDTPEEIPKFIYAEIERQLRDNYQVDVNENLFVRGVLHGELQALKKTPDASVYIEDKSRYREFELSKIKELMSDRHVYMTKVFHHLKKGRNCSIALFFDNLDRRKPEMQEAAFMKAAAIARDWASLVFIALRPDTYYRSLQNGVLDTIAPIAFTVGQPDLSLVLKRRFAYAKAIAEGRTIDAAVVRGAPSSDISFDLPRVAKIFESCEFAAWKRHGIIPVLEAVSNANIRKLLEFVRRILSSGHLDTKKILEKIETTGSYFIPDYEGVKTLLYGDYMQFDPSRSPFVNLFDIRYNDPAEHFLRFSILQYLSKIQTDSDPALGYIKELDLSSYLAALGFSHGVISDAIAYLIDRNCIEKHLIPDSAARGFHQLRITSLGRYHIFSLLPVFQYLDAVAIDTPIIDEEVRKKIKNVQNIHERTQRTEEFINYLNQCTRYISDTDVISEWNHSLDQAKDNLEEVRQRASKKA